MSEYTVETRRRSRSKTPFLRSSCDHENCEHAGEEGHVHQHKKKAAALAPNVQSIVEEVVEVTSSSSSPSVNKVVQSKSQQQQQQQQKIKTSDYSSEDASPENRAKKSETLQKYASTTTTTTSTTIIAKSKKIGNTHGSATTSTPKANYTESFVAQFAEHGSGSGSGISRRRKEIAQNELNAAFERSQRESVTAAVAADSASKRQNRSFSRFFATSFGNNSSVNTSLSAQRSAEQNADDDLSDHLAYMEYKRAGEYWKKTPKTDYTYSKLSPHRRVLAPGVVAMPNMSRRSLENHHERINYMIERDPAQEEYIRRRYEASKYAQNRRETEKLLYDSGDELDYNALYSRKRYYNGGKYAHQEDVSWFTRIITTIVTTLTSVWTSVSGGAASSDESTLYRTHYTTEERGFFGKITHAVASSVVGLFRYIYIGISSVLYWDTWLLQSSNADGRNKKRFLLLLLILLPLLLLGAWALLDESERAYYLQGVQTLVPLSLLASIKSTLQNTGATLKAGFSQLPALFSGARNEDADARLHLYNLKQNMQKTLTPEEYENILNHINSYVQKLVDIKIQEEAKVRAKEALHMTPQQTHLIVEIIRENLERVVRDKRAAGELKLSELSADELQHLVQLVQLQLEASGWTNERPVRLTTDNLADIKKLVSEQIEVDNHAHYTLLLEHIDLDALLERILGAPQMTRFIDARIQGAFDQQQILLANEAGSGAGADLNVEQQHAINALNSEIAFVKLALSEKLAENAGLQQSISKLQVGQDDLLLRMQEHELATDQRFSALLAEIERKLASLNDEHFTLLNKQIKLSLVEILGFKQTPNGAKLEDVDLQNWVRSMFVAKDFLEQRLLALNAQTDERIKAEIDRSGSVLMRDISERLKSEILLIVERKQNASAATLHNEIRAALSETEVRKIVASVLAIYDADKTGLVDFALESAGGQILSTRCTESYQTKTAQLSIFGIPLWYPTNTPRVAISPNVQPGECWAFQGFPGFLVLKLNSLVYVTGFTLEHIPKTLAPNGRIDSAPRNFTVWGLEHEKDQEPVFFGEYEYADNNAALQYFAVQNTNIKRPYEIVELRIESNHGHAAYTCLYRFRVHGKPPLA